MPQDKVGLEQLQDDADGKEQFWIVFVDGEKAAAGNGYIRNTSAIMNEAQVRAFFERGGQPAHEVEEMFRLARENFKR